MLRDADLFKEELETLGELAKDKDAVIAHLPEVTLAEGKELLLEVLGGKAPPVRFQGNVVLKKIQRLSRLLRWTACTCLQEEYVRFAANEKKWAEASTFAVWWQRAEACVLRSWVLFVLEKATPHLSLHFDGLRVHRDRCAQSGGVEALAEASSEHIARETGFAVEIVEKKHHVLFDMIKNKAEHEEAKVGESCEVLLAEGNCIPLALWRADSEAIKQQVLTALDRSSGVNLAARSVGGRSYRECFLEYKVSATPQVGFQPTRTGSYLVHAEWHGRPHCIMARCNVEEDSCVLPWRIGIRALHTVSQIFGSGRVRPQLNCYF